MRTEFQRRNGSATPKSFLAILLAVLFLGLAAPKQAKGETDEEITNEIMAIEHEKEAALGKGMSAVADWFELHNADNLAWMGEPGLRTKAEVIHDMRSGNQHVKPERTYDYRVRVHGNGTTALLTYRTIGTFTIGDKTFGHQLYITDVYAKENGQWIRVVHDSSPVPANKQGQ